ncbi:MAG: hypothetical protein HKM24_03345 [Gammaproteobacteria bacterium]|nr:hypothetical protein [Gammaproteobacteria bacterium]
MKQFLKCALLSLLTTNIGWSQEAPTVASDGETTQENETSRQPEDSYIELETTEITGNRELPKVLAIVPWKKALPADLAGKPENSLLNEIISPVDRDVFQLQNRFYDELNPPAENEKKPQKKSAKNDD